MLSFHFNKWNCRGKEPQWLKRTHWAAGNWILLINQASQPGFIPGTMSAASGIQPARDQSCGFSFPSRAHCSALKSPGGALQKEGGVIQACPEGRWQNAGKRWMTVVFSGPTLCLVWLRGKPLWSRASTTPQAPFIYFFLFSSHPTYDVLNLSSWKI